LEITDLPRLVIITPFSAKKLQADKLEKDKNKKTNKKQNKTKQTNKQTKTGNR